MIVIGKFSLSRDEILAASLNAANFIDNPYKSSTAQLRRLLNM